jgi:glucose/arabinose dehydrogenase
VTYKIKLFTILAAITFIGACGDSSDDKKLAADTFSNACLSDASAQATSAAVPPGGAAITTERVFTALSFTQPLQLRQEPADDRCWYVVEQPGVVMAFENDADVSSASTFIDINTRVDSGPFEGGLLGMAFHPDYLNNGEVFLSYTGNNSGLTSVISRFTSNNHGLTLDPDSEEIIITFPQPFDNHNGGNIEFGPDGYLYIGFGDGGSSNDPGERAQNTLNLFGAILRIDVDAGVPYSIPVSNPFSGNALCDQGFGATDCPELYAWGLRNPWRWSFDSATDELWLGDVGQARLEEVDIIELGGNYGWPFFEGTRCNTEAPVVNCDFVGLLPVTEYGRADGRAVTGGYIYRGAALPDLFGAYVYADSVSGALFQYFNDNGDIIEAKINTGLYIVTFGQSNNGELFVADISGGGIYQIVAAP